MRGRRRVESPDRPVRNASSDPVRRAGSPGIFRSGAVDRPTVAEESKPGSVPGLCPGRSSLWGAGRPTPRAAYPKLVAAGRRSLPIRPCCRRGLPCRPPLPASAVGSYPTLAPLPVRPTPALAGRAAAVGGLLSVALAVASRRPGLPRLRTLCSPDFPRAASPWPLGAEPGGRGPARDLSLPPPSVLRTGIPSRPGTVGRPAGGWPATAYVATGRGGEEFRLRG